MFNQNGAAQWRKMLTENFNVTDTEKLNWISEYASVHEIHENQTLGVNANSFVPTAANPGVNPLYATPLNTTGMGNPMAPQNPNVASTAPAAAGNLWNQTVGSGDIPVSTLPMALNVALLTIGIELVPVIPAKGPWAMLSYMDFPYAGGKLGRVNETSFDGKGTGNENKPIYVKVTGLTLAQIGDLRKTAKEGDKVTVGAFEGTFLGFGRMDGAPMAKVVTCGDANTSLVEAFDKATSVVVGETTVTLTTDPVQKVKPDFVQTSVDFIDGFANFATGKKEAMTRAQNETGTGNVIGLRLFSKWVQMGSYEVTGTVTRQQLQDLPLYGVDAVGKVMEALQNEITQSINARILERVFALGATNAAQLKYAQGIDLNLYLGKAENATKNVSEMASGAMTDIYGNVNDWAVANQEVLTSAENTTTRQRRLSSRILAAANIIQTVGRRGRATWVIVNSQIASALQDCSGYVVAPMVNNMAQDGSQNLFLGGTLAGLKVYVDPYMAWDDTRICIGRKGDGNSPGVVFMPYILADTVSITAEGTMAPKMLVNSRYAIAEAGFYPETQYLTFAAFNEFGWI